MILNKDDIVFLLQHFRRYLKDKDEVLKESTNNKERKDWDRFFKVTESKCMLKRLEEAFNRYA